MGFKAYKRITSAISFKHFEYNVVNLTPSIRVRLKLEVLRIRT